MKAESGKRKAVGRKRGRRTPYAFRLSPCATPLGPCTLALRNQGLQRRRHPAHPGPQPTERLYTGQVWDWNANVYHYVARVYVPDLARSTSTDPVREYANPYAYVKWAPTALIDPTGMFSMNGLELYSSMGMGEQYARFSGGYAQGFGFGTPGPGAGTSASSPAPSGSLTANLQQWVSSAVLQALPATVVKQINSILQAGGAASAANPVSNQSVESGPTFSPSELVPKEMEGSLLLVQPQVSSVGRVPLLILVATSILRLVLNSRV